MNIYVLQMLCIRHILKHKIVLLFVPDAKRSGHVLLRSALGTSNEVCFCRRHRLYSLKPALHKARVHYTTLQTFCCLFGQLMTNVGGLRT
jgi:hypothetical protein